jgi:hypothetical protein
MPSKANLAGRYALYQKQTDVLFDSTAIHANEILGATLAGALTNRAMRWFKAKFRDNELNDLKDAADWMDECTEALYFGLGDSNFYSEVNENYLDLGAFGTDALLAEEGSSPGSLRFTAVPVGDYCAVEGHDRRVNTIFRKVQMPAGLIVDRWGKRRVSPDVARLSESSEKDKTVAVMHVVMPREGGRPGRGRMAQDLPFASYYFEADQLQLLEESGYHEWPIPVCRWRRASGEIYGRGPSDTALPDIKTLNKVTEQKLLAGALSIRPPLIVPSTGVIGRVRLQPAALNVVQMIPGAMNPPIQPMIHGSDIRVAENLEERLEQKIYRTYYYDLFTLPESGPEMTAREVSIRDERNQRALGPTVGRLEYEKFNPLIKRCFGIMFRAGELPDPPESVLQAIQEGRGQIDIEYQGPLAQAQRSGDTLAIERWATMWIEAALKLEDPSMLDIANWDEMEWHSADVSGVPSKVLHSRDEVQAIREARAEKEARQQAIQERLAGSEEMRNKAPYVKAIAETAGPDAAGEAV